MPNLKKQPVETVSEKPLTEEQQKRLAHADKLISDLQAKLKRVGLKEREVNAINSQIMAFESAKELTLAPSQKSSYSDLPLIPEGTYISEVVRTSVNNTEGQDGKKQVVVGLGMKPITAITIDAKFNATYTDLGADVEYQLHWVNYNKLVMSIKTEGSAVESGISKFFKQLGVNVADIAHIDPSMLQDDSLIGLRVIDTITYREVRDKTYANSSLVREPEVGIYTGSYKMKAVELREHNKPIIASYLEIDEDDFSYVNK